MPDRRPARSHRRSVSTARRADTLADAVRSDAVRALVLQGGGALGAYQAGVYEVLAERREAVDWVAGVSIGAINAALIAGNAPEQRVDRLRTFWQLVSSGAGQSLPGWSGERSLLNQLSASAAMAAGVPGFFEPRPWSALWLGLSAPVTSVYDTAPLRATLERLVDFDRINAGGIRFSVGAVNVRTGNSIYFDNSVQRIRPEHVMASGALPPGFPPIRIDGEHYWDGGLVSNTPLQYVLDEHERSRRLIALQVDLFSARGALPATLGQAMARQKDIQYSSRTRLATDALAANASLQETVVALLEALPPSRRRDPAIAALCARLRQQPIDIVHLIYRHKPHELDSKDYDFSRLAVEEHWEAGRRDLLRTFENPQWLRRTTTAGITTYDLGDAEAGGVRHAGALRAR
ncbi:MAG: patatin-like phospholipase family protein [Lautropia sp.]